MPLPKLTPLQQQIFALGAACLLAVVFAPAWILFFYVLFPLRAHLYQKMEELFIPNRRWYVYIPFIPPLLVLIIFRADALPTDDLLRHITAYHHGYDYTHLYLYLDPAFPKHSMWIGFEWITGHLHRLLGLNGTISILQIIALSTAWLSLRSIFRRILQQHSEREIFCFCLLVLALSGALVGRTFQARPEIFLGIWMITALCLPPLLWTAIGLLLQPLYWLSPIYCVGALLLPLRLRYRFLIMALLAGTAVVFWFWYAGLEWPRFYWQSIKWIQNREIGVSENISITNLFASPTLLFLVLGLLVLGNHFKLKESGVVLIVLAWFLLPGQIRYGGTIIPLLAIMLAQSLKTVNVTLLAWQRAALIGIGLLLTLGILQGIGLTTSFPRLKSLQGNEKILTPFNTPTYALPAQTFGVKVAPGMEVGATESRLQILINNIVNNKPIDCEEFKHYSQFTHVIERSINTIPFCWELQEISNGWRLWRIKPQL